MEGVVELAEEIFHTPVRIRRTQDVLGLNDIVRNPIYSTGVGLLHYALKQHGGANLRGGVARQRKPRDTNAPSFFTKAKSWLQNNF